MTKEEDVDRLVRNSAAAITNLVAIFPFTHDELSIIGKIIGARFNNKRYVSDSIEETQDAQ